MASKSGSGWKWEREARGSLSFQHSLLQFHSMVKEGKKSTTTDTCGGFRHPSSKRSQSLSQDAKRTAVCKNGPKALLRRQGAKEPTSTAWASSEIEFSDILGKKQRPTRRAGLAEQT